MDLRHLGHLVALADAGSFSRAAERVHLTQPAFSRSVRAAEAELGLQLFDRGSREITCTVAGAFVIARARKLLFDSRCLERDVNLYRERLAGDLAFGVGPFPAVALLPGLMVELRTRFAAIRNRVEINNWKYLLEHLRAEELEFFVSDVRDVPRDQDLSLTGIGRLPGRFYVRAGHPLLSRRNLKPGDMARYGIASVALPADVRAAMRELLSLGPDEPLPIAVECDDLHLLKRIALSTDTVLGSISASVAGEVKAGDLKELRLGRPRRLGSSVGIVSLKGRSFSPMASFAVGYLTEAMAQPAD